MTKVRHRIKTQPLTFWADWTLPGRDLIHEICECFFDDGEYTATDQVLDAIDDYCSGLKAKEVLPSLADEKYDLVQLFAAINEVERRVSTIPPKAETFAYTEARKQGMDWFQVRDDFLEQLKQLRSLAGMAVYPLSQEDIKTNPGKAHRNNLILGLSEIFCSNTDYENTTYRNRDQEQFR